MTSATLGQNTSRVEVTNVSPHRFWLFVDKEELFRAVQRVPVVHGRVHSRDQPRRVAKSTPSVLAGLRHRSGGRITHAPGALSIGEPDAAEETCASETAASQGEHAGQPISPS